jgi:hypothetical protein
MGCWTRVYRVFLISMYSKIMLISSEKTKKMLCLWRYFDILILVFCVIKRALGSFLLFSCFICNFLIEKLLARVPHELASRWHLCHSSGACDAARWSNLFIRCLPGYVAIPSYTCCGSCRWIMVGLPPVIDCFCFFFLFSLLTTKVHNCPLYLLFVNFSPYTLNFLFHPYSFYRIFFFNFVLQLQFLIYFIFHFSPHSFNFLFCFYSFLVSILLNSSLFLVGVSKSILFVLIYYFSHFSLLCEFYLFTI